MLEIRPGTFAHASGALWLADSGTLLAADVHLGYGWALRRRGQLGPVGDDLVCRKLMETAQELQPGEIVFLGDLVHAPRPAPEERHEVESTLRTLAEKCKVVVVLGNHDRGFVRDFPSLPVEICRMWRGGNGELAVHGDREIPEAEHVIIGHLHPALGVTDHAGASHRLPVFISGDVLTLLPAYSPLAAGCDIRDGIAIRPHGAKVFAASGIRVVPLGGLERFSRR
ncbi:MAG: metallophosphoesterase [Bryobacteraceae bacterium]|nr:metallophosphoesterase [Bryobacteraceae bacterium]